MRPKKGTRSHRTKQYAIARYDKVITKRCGSKGGAGKVIRGHSKEEGWTNQISTTPRII